LKVHHGGADITMTLSEPIFLDKESERDEAGER
jgi:hypothetical protein